MVLGTFIELGTELKIDVRRVLELWAELGKVKGGQVELWWN